MSMEMLKNELDKLSPTSIQRERLESDPTRGLASLAKAREAGAKNPLSYAISVFNSTTFETKKATATNRSVVTGCQTCGGDRFVVWEKQEPPYDEAWVPCPDCNANCNTLREGFASPSPDRVRERLSR